MLQSLPSSPHARGTVAVLLTCLAAPLPLCLGGCVANSSNPAVAVRSARVGEREASFELELTNPGGRDLVVTGVDYDLSHGESAFPVASGSWQGDVELPARGRAMVALVVPFDVPPIEPESRRLHLNGELLFTDRTGFLGMRSMDLTRTSFRADVEAQRGTP